MDFRLLKEEEELRLKVREFVQAELVPLESIFDEAPDIFEGTRWKTRARLSSDPEVKRYIEVMEGLERKAEARGLWYLDVPKQYGGLQVSNVAMIAVTEELEQSSVPFELGNHVSNILYGCKGEQVERFLLPCIRGEKTACFGLTEPGAGSDPSMLATTASPDGDYFILNGSKIFPTFADVADFIQVFARLPGTQGHEGITCFLVETGTPGYQVVRSVATIAGTEPCELVFENCRVPKGQVLGELGKGWALNQAWLGARRFQVGIRSHGMAKRTLRLVRDYFKDAVADSEKSGVSLGGFIGELEALRSLTYFGAWKADQGMDVRFEAASVKLFSTELLHRVIDFGLEVIGPSAFRKTHKLGRFFRHARIRRIIEGPSEIQRHIIQRALFREGAALMEIR
ncbi:MAG: acyl-CoA dehydrogenase family protein [Deltaproteobacteria bacterium]|nr:acyl-CoA dehydrogenase family protein [Deltaproteobacteria bacterium]